jgi:hypothetical protein
VGVIFRRKRLADLEPNKSDPTNFKIDEGTTHGKHLHNTNLTFYLSDETSSYGGGGGWIDGTAE